MKVHDKVTSSFQYLFLASKVFESSQQSLQKLSVFTSRSRSSNKLLKVHNKSQHNHKLSVFISHRSQHGLKVHKKVTWSCQYSFLDSQEVIQNSREGASSLTQKLSHVTTQYQSVYIKIFFVCPRKCLDYSWLDELPNPIILSKTQNKVSIHALFLLGISQIHGLMAIEISFDRFSSFSFHLLSAVANFDESAIFKYLMHHNYFFHETS